MTVYAITDTKKGRTGIAPTYLQTTQNQQCQLVNCSTSSQHDKLTHVQSIYSKANSALGLMPCQTQGICLYLAAI